MFHHKKADRIIETWDKHIRCPEVVQRVPLLFLANDVLRRSKTKVNQFITRFWKILPLALKEVVENGKADEQEAVFRLKLSIGSSAEKIVSASELVLQEHANEDKETSKCKSAVHRVEKLEKYVDKALKRAKDSLRTTVAKRLMEEEENLEKSIDKLRSFEANRAALVFQLQDALREQESELENIRKQIEVAEAQAAEIANMIRCLGDKEDCLVVETKGSANKSVSEMAAELADKLLALSSSLEIMMSVLAKFVAEYDKNRIIATWDKHIRCPEVVQRVPLLFLANDILRRSKTKKLCIGSSVEKIVSAFEFVLQEHANEDKEKSKCKSAVHRVEKLEKDFDKALTKAKDSLRTTVTKRWKEEEENLEKSIDKLRSFEANRAALVFQLQDALREQEFELENVRKQIQVAEATANMIQRLGNKEDCLVVETKGSANKSVSEMAAELADKLLASSSSQEIMMSKTKVNRFITRFWKILPSALKEVVENGKADEKEAVFRLIRIWEREKVFGSLSQSLKDILLEEGSPPPPSAFGPRRKCSGSVTITKRDEQSIRTKLCIGSSVEKIVSAFELVLQEHANEDKETSKCKSAVHHVEKLEKDVDKAFKKAKDSFTDNCHKKTDGGRREFGEVHRQIEKL
ncbi:UNVERIFIED_CONTAM: hypothetical protein Scaly_1040800 [Sesamum calycinum]|uniref:CID domain-containing protein n=1 Tax=Sesamum calycinum TaxID=2727403 RepID=A0AAW2QJZ8_9LAMI